MTAMHPHATELDHDVAPGSPEWQRYATGSKIAAILGISPHTTRLQQWRHMIGDAGTTTVTAHMRWGTDREPIIRAGAEAAFGCHITQPRMLVSTADPRHAYSPDGIFEDALGGVTLWEAKTATAARFAADWADGVPPCYCAQVQWGLWVTGLTECVVTVEVHDHFEPQTTCYYTITADPEWHASTAKTVNTFLSHVEARTEPPPLGGIVLDAHDAGLVRAWAAANRSKLDAEADLRATRPAVDKLGHGADALIAPDGETLCHWITRKGATTSLIDWDRLEHAHPQLASKARTVIDRDAFRALLTPEQIAEHTVTTTTPETRALKMGPRK